MEKKKIKFVEGSLGRYTQCKYCSYYGSDGRCNNSSAEYYGLYNDPDQYCHDGD